MTRTALPSSCWLLALSCFAACKAAPEPRAEEPLLDARAEERAASTKELASPPVTTPPAPLPPTHPSGTIGQSELYAILDTSPGVFLSHVDADPRLVGGRFAGWQIRRFFPGDARFVDSPIQPGDVVLRVNGSTLERPDQLAALWKRLRDATQLEVEVSRAGTVTVWRWPIVADHDKVPR